METFTSECHLIPWEQQLWLCRILWIFFPLCFHGLDPKKGEKLSNPVGGFQEGLTDNLTKVELQMSSLWCPFDVKGTWALWKFCFDPPVVFGNFPVALIWVSSHFSSQWSECFLSSFHLRVIPQVSLSGLWKLRVEPPPLSVKCLTFRVQFLQDSVIPRFTEVCFSGVECLGVTDRHVWWLDHCVLSGIWGRLESSPFNTTLEKEFGVEMGLFYTE